MNKGSQPIGLLLKQLAKREKVPVNDIAASLSISPQGVYDMFRRTSVSTRTIERFCQAIGIDPREILQENTVKINSTNENTSLSLIEDQRNEIEYLRKLVAQLAQSNQALIEKLGKSEAGGLLAEYDA